ncbi:MAG: methyltransferase domain-containing protein [Rikenellaceae bacterium]
MSELIKWILNHLPRPIMQRLASIGVPLLGLLYLGRGKECPICGCRRRAFLPYGYITSRKNALCPSCLSLERHRLLWLFIKEHTSLLNEQGNILHIAPELAISKRLKHLPAYTTADLESPLATMHFDVQQIPLEDDSQDVILCNHILEHVEDDRLAMRELCRVMRPGGWGIILSPLEMERADTFEDESITDPKERTRIFGQYDHRRIYGRDYADRLRESGFEVEQIDFFATISKEKRELYSLLEETIFLVRK